MSKILVVEDENDFQHILEQVLSEKYEVVFASDGETGLEKVESESPDILLLDVNLPGMSGWEVLLGVRGLADKKARNTPVIMLTVRKEDMDQLTGFSAGADDYISKPFVPQELLLRIDAVLRRGDRK